MPLKYHWEKKLEITMRYISRHSKCNMGFEEPIYKATKDTFKLTADKKPRKRKKKIVRYTSHYFSILK